MGSFDLKKTDLSKYNKAENPWITIDDNGKVDIGNKIGDIEKISLEKRTIIRFINQYLRDCSHELSGDDKKNILSSLNLSEGKDA
ncbi:hypothetical protein Desaci_4762 (plasmid) [Desulfosporosinus acidiphilus SJ4]|uniref:Uncharacterized protein n=1 Tax=Desulfosporosinus acidiphilus (strain DSM 22704 / JCM 16185 / SJ4) TaxID=646529 RepID=I4DCR4_DESAJ|nr:hypothetical protein [Desulfosporosinus acidiphilus]AFM43588.1 hypothetical protein Desaci_4762 [Desulfosporosinus acidiphilus SJ4]